MKIVSKNSSRVIVEFEFGETIPEFIFHRDGFKRRKFWHKVCEECDKHFYARKQATNICSASCSKSKSNRGRSGTKVVDKLSPFRIFVTFAKRRKHSHNITPEYLQKLWDKQGGCCAYTGVEMILPPSTAEFSKTKVWNKASLDRIDSSKGYIKGNVQFVCMSINYAKSDMPEEQIIEMIKSIRG